MSRYNLIDEEWIPVIDLAGRRKERSIHDTLLNAEKYAAIEDPSPLVTASLYRFLLAILYRALKGPCDPAEAKKLFEEGLPKDKIQEYLSKDAKWYSRFYLFDDNFPFGQNKNIPNNELEPWTKLAAEFNSTSSKVLFDHTDFRYNNAPSFSAVSKWIVTTMNFSVRGGRGYSPSPSANGLMVFPVGRTLLETLLFCLVPYPNRIAMESDLASWEQEPPSLEYFQEKPERVSNGFADRYTWPARAMRLIEEKDGSVKDIAFIAGVRHLVNDNANTEAMVPMTVDVKRGIRPIELEDKGLWRDFESLIPNGTDRVPKTMDNMIRLCGRKREKYAKSFMAIGQNFSNAKVEFWRMEKYVLPQNLIENNICNGLLHDMLKTAEAIGGVLEQAAREMGKTIITHGERDLEQDKWKNGKLIPGDVTKYLNSLSAIPVYWSELEQNFHGILHLIAIEKDPDDIHYSWLIAVRDALSSSWTLHEQSINGSDVWAIRAFVKANAIVSGKISELNQMIEKLNPIQITPANQEVK